MNIWNTKNAGKVAGTRLDNRCVTLIVNRVGYKAHRVIWLLMTGEWPSSFIDHEDTNKQNNKWSNLRLATKAQNSMNRPVQSNNKLGMKGVYRVGNRYVGHIKKDGEKIVLGTFGCPTAAHFSYCRAASKLFGEFARTE